MAVCPRACRESASNRAASGLSSTTRIRSPGTAEETGAGAATDPVPDSRAGRAANGSRMLNRAPRFLPSLCASTLPPCARIRLFTMARPRPSPPSERSISWRSCANRSKMRGSMSGAIPRPVSMTLNTAWEPSRRAGHLDLATGVGILRRIRQQIGHRPGPDARYPRPPRALVGTSTVSTCQRLSIAGLVISIAFATISARSIRSRLS